MAISGGPNPVSRRIGPLSQVRCIAFSIDFGFHFGFRFPAIKKCQRFSKYAGIQISAASQCPGFKTNVRRDWKAIVDLGTDELHYAANLTTMEEN